MSTSYGNSLEPREIISKGETDRNTKPMFFCHSQYVVC
jgi:hypothetical protein